MLKLIIDYPDREEELKILEANANLSVKHEANPVVDAETLFRARKMVDGVYLDDKLKGYLVGVVLATRQPDRYGASELSRDSSDSEPHPEPRSAWLWLRKRWRL